MLLLERCPKGGDKFFCRWSDKFVSFRRTRIAYLHQQVDANLQKKGHRPNWHTFLRMPCRSPKEKVISPNWPTFYRVFCRYPTIKKRIIVPTSSNCRKGKNFAYFALLWAVWGSCWAVWGGQNFCLGGATPWPSLVAALGLMHRRSQDFGLIGGCKPQITCNNVIRTEVESSRTHFEVLGLGLEASSPRKLACPRLEDSTIFWNVKILWSA